MKHVLIAWAILAATSANAVPLSIVGTNDLHGRVERTAVLSGHVENLRAALKRRGGGVVLVDAGDMFQGTLESNLEEGHAVVEAYNLMGYTAVTIGNHEFDFGPVGPAATAKDASDDPRGALKARAAQARFPFLAANILDDATRAPVDWPNVRPTALVRVAGVHVGLIGLSTIDTPATTIASNFRGLHMMALADAVVARAAELRTAGAQVIVVVAHAGGRCHLGAGDAHRHDPHDAAACEPDHEVMRLARALPTGAVHAIVAGHTHATMAHVVNGIPIVESWANGRGFGRIDLDVDRRTGAVTLLKLHAPQRLCGGVDDHDVPLARCAPAPYEGRAVRADARILRAIAPALQKARALRDEPLGVVVESEVRLGYDDEAALGNLFADLMRTARPDADVTLMNGGGVRANLAPGPLTYGDVFLMMPFDNRFATLEMTAQQLRALLARNLSATKKGGLFSLSGLRASVTCGPDGAASVTLRRDDGAAVHDDTVLRVVTTDFIATGGDGGLGVGVRSVILDEGEPLRDHLARALRTRGGTLRGDDPALFGPSTRRFDTVGQTRARCAVPVTTAADAAIERAP
jgi:5'-nucleotidase